MTSDGDSNQEIKVRIGQAKTATKQLNSLLWSPRITKNNKIRIYKTIVESIGLYGAELWEINKRNKSIRAMELDYWRRCCRPVSYTHLDVYKRQDQRIL